MAYIPAKAEPKEAANFIETFVNEDILEGKVAEHIHTRFPPEPNGYLHIGHIKAVCIDFGVAQKYGGLCNLRYDDTNPTKEEPEFVDAIQEDIAWLGFEWTGGIFYGSDYFDKIYDYAVMLIGKGMAYVDDLNSDQIREYRGTLTEPGTDSPYRNRSIEENLKIFDEMRQGKYADGEKTLRAKIDMSSPNINMRDPVLYRIRHAEHYNTGNRWCIYPMYDFAHPIQDALEGITHSLCSLEYEAHRPLYNWVIEQLEFVHKPRQIEFARLNITGTIMSKRYLRRLVEEKYVEGWDDPRMPTLCGMRRRGFTPAAIRDFVTRVGVSKADSIVDYAFLEHCVRENLDDTAQRAMGVLEPLKVTLINYPEDTIEMMDTENHPKNPEMGTRQLPFGRNLYIERTDFEEIPPPKYYRLKPGGEVRLKSGYIIRCEEVIKDAQGCVTELLCTYDPGSKTGGPTANRKIKGTIHWVEASTAVPAQIRVYNALMMDEKSEVDEDFVNRLNPDSMFIYEDALVEQSLASAQTNEHFQFMRQGYFNVDLNSTPQKLVFNRTVSLKDSWAKMMQ